MAAAHAYGSPRPFLSTASPPRRPRKSTAVARREEKAELLKELEVLRAWLRLRRVRQREKRVAEIKQEFAGAEATRANAGANGEEAGAAALVQASTFDARTVAKAATLLRLRSAVRDCHLMVSSLHGQLCAHSASQSREALYTALALPAATTQRREMVRLCHAQAIRDGDEFIRARCSGMDLLMPYSSQEQFQDPASGELCAVQFEVTQFPGVQRVHDVFAAVRFWATNLEICVSEQLGDVTIREDTEDDESDEPTPRGPAFSSVRCIRSQLACGVAVGGCQAIFGQVIEDEDYAVMTVQPVDADARRVGHEYECAGNDVLIRSSVVVRVARVDGVVVLTRWARIAFRATHDHGSVTPLQLRATLTAGVGRWLEVFQRVVWEQLAVAAPALQQPLLYDLR